MAAAGAAGALAPDRTRPRRRRRRPNLARLNHVLIPRRSDDRARLRRGLIGVLIRPAAWAHGALTREGRAALGLSLMVAAAGLDVGTSQVYLLWAALTGVLLASVAARPLFSVRGARLRVSAPRRVVAGAPMTFALEVTADRALRALRVDTPFLPWDGRWRRRPEGVAEVEPGKPRTVTAEARFLERGEHHLDPFELRALVPLGLAAGPPTSSETCRFLVLPRPARIASLRIAPGASAERRRLATTATSTEGELAGVRPYRPGDPLRTLHARTWARTGEPHVREHVLERDERAGLFVLVDRLGDEALTEAALSLAAGAAETLSRAEGGLGLVALGADVGEHAGGSARAALDDALERLATFTPPAALDAADALAAVAGRLASLSSAVVVAAERDEAPEELPPAAAEVSDALRRAGLGVVVLLVVLGETRREGLDLVLVSKEAIDSDAELAL